MLPCYGSCFSKGEQYGRLNIIPHIHTLADDNVRQSSVTMSTPFGVTVRSYIPKKASTHVRPAEAPLSHVRSIQFSRKLQLLGVAVQDLDSVVQVACVAHKCAAASPYHFEVCLRHGLLWQYL